MISLCSKFNFAQLIKTSTLHIISPFSNLINYGKNSPSHQLDFRKTKGTPATVAEAHGQRNFGVEELRMQMLSMKKAPRRLLESLDVILQVASEISMLSLEESKEPTERQWSLSPGSERKSFTQGPPSPSMSTSSIASPPSQTSILHSTPGSSSGSHAHKLSEFGALEHFRLNHLDGVERRNTVPSSLHKASVPSSVGKGSVSDHWPSSVGQSLSQFDPPPSLVHSIDLKKGPIPQTVW
jgi:hypothetical protein